MKAKPKPKAAKVMKPWSSFTQSFFEMEKMQTLCEHFAKDCKDIKASLELKQEFVSTTVYAVAIGQMDYMNQPYMIHCNGGTALNHCCYNVARDGYEVCAVEHMLVGTVPICYQLEIAGILDFTIDLPLPEKVFTRYLTEPQLAQLKQFKKKYNKEDFDIVFLQMLSSTPPMEIGVDVAPNVFPAFPMPVAISDSDAEESIEQDPPFDDGWAEDEEDEEVFENDEESPSW